MIVTILVSAVVLFVGTVVYTRSRPFAGPPRCPSCQVDYLALPTGDEPLPYDVLVCPECSNTNVVVHGATARFCQCPACRQRTLEVRAQRLPPRPEAPISVGITEHCHLCGHVDELDLPDPGVKVGRGQVIPFPTRR